MNKLKDFNNFVFESNIKNDDYQQIMEGIDIVKYQNSIKKFFKETKIQLYYVLTFGTSLTVLLPVVEKFMKTGNFQIELDDRNVTLLTIYAFSVLVHESKDKLKKIYDILKERDATDEDIQKSVNILRNIHELFKITLEGTGKLVDNFLDMISYSGMLIPFISVLSSLVTDGKVSSELMSGSFKTFALTIGSVSLKLLIHRILHKLDKIVKGTNKFQNKDNIKPLLVNDELKSPMYKSENAYIEDNVTESIKHLLVGPTEDEVIDQLKDKPNNLLDYSIRNNFLSGIKYAVSHGANVFKLVRELKLKVESLDIIKFLKEEYDVNVNDFSYNIHKIIDDNNELINNVDFKYLVENGLDVNYKHDFYLRIAAYHGYVDIAKLLIEKGSHVDTLDNQTIWQASMNGHLEMVKLLEENGADIHTGDDRPLRYSAGMGYIDVVEYCLTKNPSMTSVITSLEEAQEQKFLDVVEILKKYINEND